MTPDNLALDRLVDDTMQLSEYRHVTAEVETVAHPRVGLNGVRVKLYDGHPASLTGRLMASGSAATLAEAITRAADDLELLRAYGKASRELAAEAEIGYPGPFAVHPRR